MMTANKINWTFRENDEIKVAKVDNGLITAWYPTGEANYKIEESDSGNRTLYFHPNGNPKWSCYYFTLE